MSHFEESQKLIKLRQSFVIVTMLSGRGHTPQDPGAKAIVTSEGLHWGTIGGGKVEARAIDHAKQILKEKKTTPEVVTWNLQKDIGMSCGGEGTYLFETFCSYPWKIAIFGAGHVAQALTRTLINFDCQVVCVDSRSEWCQRLPEHDNLRIECALNPSSLVQNFDENHFFVVMTQGHASDVPILAEIFSMFPSSPYIGVIGSSPKALKIKTELKARGLSEELLNHLRCPMGLPIGNNQPNEIAISIAAELLQVRDRFFKVSNAAPKDG